MQLRRYLPTAIRVRLLGWMTSVLHGQPVINEIHFDPPDKTQPAEFVELFNPSPNPVALDGWQIQGGIAFTFPPQTVLPPQGFLVVAQNPSVLQSTFGVAGLGPWTGRLRNENERIELRAASALFLRRLCGAALVVDR